MSSIDNLHNSSPYLTLSCRCSSFCTFVISDRRCICIVIKCAYVYHSVFLAIILCTKKTSPATLCMSNQWYWCTIEESQYLFPFHNFMVKNSCFLLKMKNKTSSRTFFQKPCKIEYICFWVYGRIYNQGLTWYYQNTFHGSLMFGTLIVFLHSGLFNNNTLSWTFLEKTNPLYMSNHCK